ncbi:MAG TPA: type II toxin-antitoxin system RelE/ParE family toxin [Thermoanaerobaculia bacterium]
MSKPLVLEAEARQELGDAARWYEDHRLGLGQRFLGAVEATLDRLAVFPAAGTPVPYVSSDLAARRIPVERFPYHVVYLETQDAIRVLAVAHNRRKPGYWLGRQSS